MSRLNRRITGPVLVTGAAGFIGSHLANALLESGIRVTGLDNFSGYYSRQSKQRNLNELLARDGFTFVEIDLVKGPLDALVGGMETVFHLAGQPGVRSSWTGFREYLDRNVLATQRLLEACRQIPNLRVINASSSSVYGNAHRFPTSESDPTNPVSPYGVTKLAAENLCAAYAMASGMSIVSLRYFSVYGPRQRPDMATHRMVESAITGAPFHLYGDGRHIRDFTFVSDVVEASICAAAARGLPGSVYNIAGGSSISISELIKLVSDIAGMQVNVIPHPASQGDALRTGGDISRAADDLGWWPRTDIQDGIKAQVEWHDRNRP